MKIVVSGLTAAGKTTASLLLAEHFGVPYFSASTALRSLAQDSSPHWTPELDERRTPQIDEQVDQEMLRLFESSAVGIFDAWGLPWFTNSPAVRVWLESDHLSRRNKCYVSWGERKEPKTLAECTSLIDSKDLFTRDLFIRSWGFDLFVDRRPFDLCLDISGLMTRPRAEDSARGIDVTRNFLIRHLESGPSEPTSARLPTLGDL